MIVRADMQVREIAAVYPSSMRQFELWGIDYCCGGERLLGDACRRVVVSVDDVIAGLCASEGVAHVSLEALHAMPIVDVIEHLLVKHHAFTRAELERATRLVTKVYRAHGHKSPDFAQIRAIVGELRGELYAHMTKEERVLFPYIEMLVDEGAGSPRFGTIASPIACMRAEHEDCASMLERLRVLTNGYTPAAGACETHRALWESLRELDEDLCVHMVIENDILFPRAIALESETRRG